MLILTRKIGEKIVISKGTIEITLVGIKGRQVVLGFNAPIDMPIDREEVYLKKLAELNQETPQKIASF